MLENDSPIDGNSDTIRAHLQIYQSIIQRMAVNSATCKGWCITLVSAILILTAGKSNPDFAYVALIPTILFLALDSYYLSLERRFRQSYNDFIKKLHDHNLITSDLYAVIPGGNRVRFFFASLCSPSVLPLYLTIGGMIWLARVLII